MSWLPMNIYQLMKLANWLKISRQLKNITFREIGLRLLALKESGFNQKEIAELEGLSQAKVTRALQAAAVPQDLIALFPVQSELSFSDYKILLEVNEKLSEKGLNA